MFQVNLLRKYVENKKLNEAMCVNEQLPTSVTPRINILYNYINAPSQLEYCSMLHQLYK